MPVLIMILNSNIIVLKHRISKSQILLRLGSQSNEFEFNVIIFSLQEHQTASDVQQEHTPVCWVELATLSHLQICNNYTFTVESVCHILLASMDADIFLKSSTEALSELHRRIRRIELHSLLGRDVFKYPRGHQLPILHSLSIGKVHQHGGLDQRRSMQQHLEIHLRA